MDRLILDEYKREGFDMFETMINGIKDEVVRRLFIVRLKKSSLLRETGCQDSGSKHWAGTDLSKSSRQKPAENRQE